MAPVHYSQFVQFLQDDLEISQNSLSLAQRYSETNPDLLPMVLWQYGLITLDQLDRIFDWLEKI